MRRAVLQYLAHYHSERNHQGPENKIIDPETNKRVTTQEEFGLLLKRNWNIHPKESCSACHR